MRNRLWNELCQAKHNSRYCISLLAHRRKVVNWFAMKTYFLGWHNGVAFEGIALVHV